MNWGKVSAVALMGITVLMFQNCAKIVTSDLSGNVSQSIDRNGGDDNSDDPSNPGNPGTPSVPNPGSPDPGDGSSYTSDAECSIALKNQTALAYQNIADTGAVVKDFKIHELPGDSLSYENIGSLSNGAITKLKVEARAIQTVRSFAANRIHLNALSIDSVSSFASSGVTVVAREVREVSSFAATFCASVQKLDSLHNLAAKLSIYGRLEDGKRAEIKEVRNLAAFFSFHNVHVTELRNGALRGRFENSVIDSLSSSSGTIYLVNSSIGEIKNFAGTIYLIGNSSVGSNSSSSVNIVKR